MNTFHKPLASAIECSEYELIVSLKDGRVLHLPLEWFPRLKSAPANQRNHYEILGDGEGVHWPDIDEDLSVEGFLRGVSLAPLKASA